MWDVADQFVATAINGGIWAFALLASILVVAFQSVGAIVHSESFLPADRFTVWCLGVSLFAHCVGFIGICYFDQMQVVWYWLLAVMGSVCGMAASIQSVGAPPKFRWFKPAFYSVLTLLLCWLTAHEERIFL